MLIVSRGLVWGFHMQVNSLKSHSNSMCIYYNNPLLTHEITEALRGEIICLVHSQWVAEPGRQPRPPSCRDCAVTHHTGYLTSSDSSWEAQLRVYFLLHSRWRRTGKEAGQQRLTYHRPYGIPGLQGTIIGHFHTSSSNDTIYRPFSQMHISILLQEGIITASLINSFQYLADFTALKLFTPNRPSGIRVSLRFGHWSNN